MNERLSLFLVAGLAKGCSGMFGNVWIQLAISVMMAVCYVVGARLWLLKHKSSSFSSLTHSSALPRWLRFCNGHVAKLFVVLRFQSFYNQNNTTTSSIQKAQPLKQAREQGQIKKPDQVEAPVQEAQFFQAGVDVTYLNDTNAAAFCCAACMPLDDLIRHRLCLKQESIVISSRVGFCSTTEVPFRA
jgi:hypothetical protein